VEGVKTYTCTRCGETKTEPVQCLVITAQPENIEGESGKTYTTTVQAQGDGLTYRWYFRALTDKTWTKSGFAGKDTDTLEIPVNATTTKRVFKCVVRDVYGNTIETNEVTVTAVTAKRDLTIISQPENIVGKKGETCTTTVQAQGDGLSYSWYFRTLPDSPWTRSGFTGKNTPTLEIPVNATTANRVFKCVIKDKHGKTVETDEVTVTIDSSLTITAQPKNIVGEKGETCTATVQAEGDGLTYTWYFRALTDSTWTKSGFTGKNTPTLQIPITTTTANRAFKCVIKDAYGNVVETNEVTVSMK
jgi:hypothetical protein